MPFIKRLYDFVMCTLLLCCPVWASAADVIEVQTDSGITAWLVEEHAQPVIALQLTFKDSGYAFDPEEKQGLASLAAELLMEGSGDKDAHAFTAALEAKAIQLATGVDEDDLIITMKTLSEHKEVAFTLLGKALTDARLDEDAIIRLKDQASTAITLVEKQPDYQLATRWKKHMFGTHPYSRTSLGTQETLAALTKADFAQYITQHLTKENVIISVVGDITRQEAAQLLDQALATLPAKYTATLRLNNAHLNTQYFEDKIDWPTPQTQVLFGFPGVPREDKDYLAAYVANHMLGGGTIASSVLGDALREESGLAYYAYTMLDPADYGSTWKGSFATRNEEADRAIALMQERVKMWLEAPVDIEALQHAKDYITGSFVLNLDSNMDVAGYLTAMQRYALGKDYLETRNAQIEAITEDDIERVRTRYIRPDQLTIVAIGKTK